MLDIRNALASVVIAIFVNEYLSSWSSFFKDLISWTQLNQPSNSSFLNERMVDLFLRCLRSLHEDYIEQMAVVDKELVNRVTEIVFHYLPDRIHDFL